MVNSKVIDFKLYRYAPSLGAAVVFIIRFGICASFHAWKLFQKRIFYFIPVLMGVLFEVVGYIGRAVSNSNPLALGPFITQALTILLAPPLFAASIYMVLGRTIVLLHAEHHSIISVKWLTKVFVGGDVLSFLTQSAGGGIQTGNTLADYNLGQNLIMAGLGIQLAFFGFFIIAAGIFHFKIIRDPTPIAASMGSSSGWRPSERSWSILLLRSEVKNGVGFGRPLWNHLIGGRESNSAIFLLTRAELRRNNPAFSHTKSIVLFLNVCL